MDALYLKENIQDALSQALTSMVISSPDDPIEFLGNYMLNYVERKSKLKKREMESIECEILAENDKKQEEILLAEKIMKEDNLSRYEKKKSQFMEGLSSSVRSKEEAFSQVAKFLSEYLNIPAVYIAVKKPVGETEALHYFSANPGQELMIGVKLPKPVESDGDEAPVRQGLSFEAFKLPEVPEEEPVELEEGEEPPPPKPAPKAQPLIIDNTMRDMRCKFYGIPKLGAYAAIPLVLNSIEHDMGCILGPQPEPPAPSEDPEAPPPEPVEPWPLYVKNKAPVGVLIGMDTIGSYRLFTPKDISVACEVGETLIKVMEELEGKLFDKQFEFMTANSELLPNFAELGTKVAEAEAAALAAVAAEIGETPIMDTLKASKEADAVAAVWHSLLTSPPVSTAIDLLQDHYLPPVLIAINLLFALFSFLGCDTKEYKDVCGDLSWTKMRTKSIPDANTLIAAFSHTQDENLNMTDAALKAYLESTGLSDPSILPANLPALPLISTWMNKMLLAREARIAYTLAKQEADAAAAAAAAEAAEAEAAAAAAAAAEGNAEE